jgi:hypothetical protein
LAWGQLSWRPRRVAVPSSFSITTPLRSPLRGDGLFSLGTAILASSPSSCPLLFFHHNPPAVPPKGDHRGVYPFACSAVSQNRARKQAVRTARASKRSEGSAPSRSRLRIAGPQWGVTKKPSPLRGDYRGVYIYTYFIDLYNPTTTPLICSLLES